MSNAPGRARDLLRSWREEPLRAVAAEARVLRVLRTRQFGAFGENSIVHRPLWLYGTKHIAVADHTMVMHQAWLAVERIAWEASDPVLRIGNRVVIRPYVTISASLSIVIEDAVTLGAGCGIYDSNHTMSDRPLSILDEPSGTAAVRIGAGSWLGDRVTVLAGADIGRKCTIGAGAVVRGVLPDYAIAVGVPARVVGSNAPQ